MKTFFISDLHQGHANCIRARGLRCEAYNVGAMWQDYEPQTIEEIISRQGRSVSVI